MSLILAKRFTSEIMLLMISGGSLQIFEGQNVFSRISYPTLTYSILLTGTFSSIINHRLKKSLKKEKEHSKNSRGKKHSNSTKRGGQGKLCLTLYQELIGARIQYELGI